MPAWLWNCDINDSLTAADTLDNNVNTDHFGRIPEIYDLERSFTQEARNQIGVALLTCFGQFVCREVDKKRLAAISDGAGGTMAEVGLLPFARVALQVATQVLPSYGAELEAERGVREVLVRLMSA